MGENCCGWVFLFRLPLIIIDDGSTSLDDRIIVGFKLRDFFCKTQIFFIGDCFYSLSKCYSE